MQLCDVAAQNPAQFTEKLTWICSRCPQPDSLFSGSPRVSRSQLNAVLAVALFLSKCSSSADNKPQTIVIEFFRAIPSSFSQSFWPQSFSLDWISSFYVDFLGYVTKATELSPDFALEISDYAGEVVLAAINNNVSENLAISRAFLLALTQNFPPIEQSDAEKLVTCLLDQFCVPASANDSIVINSDTSSSQSSPLNNHNYNPSNEISSPANDLSHVSGSSGASVVSSMSAMLNGNSVMWKSGFDSMGMSFGFNDGGGGLFRQQVASFEEETVEGLEKQVIAFKLIIHVLDHVKIDNELLKNLSSLAKKQLQSLSAFLKVSLVVLRVE